MLKKLAAFAALGTLGAIGVYWVWCDFNNALEDASISLPQRIVQEVSLPSPVLPDSSDGDDGAKYKNLERSVQKRWGSDEVVLPSPTRYVKYADDYTARSSVNFEDGNVVIETVDSAYPTRSLKDAIVSTVLAPVSVDVDQLSSKGFALGATPALYNQFRNKKGQAMRFGQRAGEYADDLIASSLEKREIKVNGVSKIVYRVNTKLVGDSLAQRAQKYGGLISSAASRYNLGERLIYAIATTESYFNPFAVSSASAYGLMQIVPSSAGAEVHEFLTGRKGKPSKSHLFNASNNIEYGTAYIHILARRYFDGVKDPASLELCTIAAYNGGPTSVYSAFGTNNREKAIAKINAMSYKNVYRQLTSKLPSGETRKYVDKVLAQLGKFAPSGNMAAN